MIRSPPTRLRTAVVFCPSLTQAHQGDELAFGNFQAKAMQDFDGFLAPPVVLHDMTQ